MLLVLTASTDVTADLLFGHAKFGPFAFRLNFDLWRDYSVAVREPDHWEIQNPAGLKITSLTASHCLWWKPWWSSPRFNGTMDDESIVAEVKYIFRELYGSFLRRGLSVGNPPDYHNRFGKLGILKIASHYFRTPRSLVGWNLPPQIGELQGKDIVAKSLSSEFTDDGGLLFASPVEYHCLDRGFPWFLQTKVDAANDVTIAVVGNDLFGFTRSRKDLKGLDWRRTIGDEDPDNPSWHPRALSETERVSLHGLCEDLGVTWGRFDFLEEENGLVFLEFNANGQWAFLDFHGTNGLTDAVVSYLTSCGAQAACPLLIDTTRPNTPCST